MTITGRPNALVIAVSGSRTVRNAELIYQQLDDRAIYYMSMGYELHWHFGEAQGVDATALLWGRERSMTDRTIFFASGSMFRSFEPESGELTTLSADWDVEGRAAGVVRNTAMLTGRGCPLKGCRGADVLFAIRAPDGPMINRGTDNCRGQAKSMNLAVMTYTVGVGEWQID